VHDDKEFMITFDCSVSINNMIYDALFMHSCLILISITICMIKDLMSSCILYYHVSTLLYDYLRSKKVKRGKDKFPKADKEIHVNRNYKSKFTVLKNAEYIYDGKEKFCKKHSFKSFSNAVMLHLKSVHNVLYKTVQLDQPSYTRPATPQHPERLKIWLRNHGDDALSRAANEAISAIINNLCYDYQTAIYVAMPNIRTSEKRVDVRKLMRNLRKIKDEEKAPNKAAKRTLCFNELIEAKQDGNESVSTYLNRMAELAQELEESGQAIGEELVAALAVKGLAPKYSSVEEESSKNALYASTSPTGESTSGLVIKSLQDIAKACRAIDVTPNLWKHKTTYGRIRNYKTYAKPKREKNKKVKKRKPICFKCYNDNKPCEHHYKECPYGDEADEEDDNRRQIHATKRKRLAKQEEIEKEVESESDESDVEESRSVFNVLKRVKKDMKNKKRKQ